MVLTRPPATSCMLSWLRCGRRARTRAAPSAAHPRGGDEDLNGSNKREELNGSPGRGDASWHQMPAHVTAGRFPSG